MKLEIILIFIISLLIFSVHPPHLKAGDALKNPVKIKSFRIRNLTGERFDSRKHLGRPLVLSFFFTRCPPCIKEMPELFEFMRQQGRLKQLLFVDAYVKALKISDAPDNKRQIQKFAERLKIPLENVYFDRIGSLLKKILQADAFPTAKKYGTLVIYPSILVIDANGRLVLSMEGSESDFLEKIRAVL